MAKIFVSTELIEYLKWIFQNRKWKDPEVKRYLKQKWGIGIKKVTTLKYEPEYTNERETVDCLPVLGSIFEKIGRFLLYGEVQGVTPLQIIIAGIIVCILDLSIGNAEIYLKFRRGVRTHKDHPLDKFISLVNKRKIPKWTELGNTMKRIGELYRKEVSENPERLLRWWNYAEKTEVKWIHDTNIVSKMNIWQHFIRKNIKLLMVTNSKKHIEPPEYPASPYPAQVYPETDQEQNELFLVIKDTGKAREADYKIRVARSKRCKNEEEPKKPKVTMLWRGTDGLRIPIWQALMKRYKRRPKGGVMACVEKISHGTGQNAFTWIYIDADIYGNLSWGE